MGVGDVPGGASTDQAQYLFLHLAGLEEALQTLAEVGAGAVEIVFDGLGGALEDGGDLGVGQVVIFGKDHCGAQRLGKRADGLANGVGALFGDGLVAWVRGRVGEDVFEAVGVVVLCVE